MKGKTPLIVSFDLTLIALLLAGCGGALIGTPTSLPTALHSQSPVPSSVPTKLPDVTVSSSDFVPVKPLVTAPYIQFASWSPDSQWFAYWISSQDDVEQPTKAMPGGTLSFLNVITGESCAVSQFITPDNQAAQVVWSDQTEAIVVLDEDTFIGKPCQPEPYRPLEGYVREEKQLTDPALSPDGQHYANTILQSNENGILTFETTITATHSAQPSQHVIWQIDERLGEYGLGGEWISQEQFLLYESLDQGPLVIDIEHVVTPILTELLGLEEIPSILGKEGYGFRAYALPGVERDSFHLLVQGVGTEENFPWVKLYHADNRLVETLPFHYIWWKPFSANGQWLLMDEHPDIGGYESHVLWIRRVEEVASDWQMIASDIDSMLWTPDWTEMAFNSAEKVIWQTFPEADRIGQWNTGQFSASPIAWSPNGRFLVTVGNIPGLWEYGMFVLNP
jgi:hypothetical protein